MLVHINVISNQNRAKILSVLFFTGGPADPLTSPSPKFAPAPKWHVKLLWYNYTSLNTRFKLKI